MTEQLASALSLERLRVCEKLYERSIRAGNKDSAKCRMDAVALQIVRAFIEVRELERGLAS